MIRPATNRAATLEVLPLADDFDAVNTAFMESGFGDGLPVVPPTRARVEAMLAATGRDPGESLGRFPPSFDEATVGAVAVNAVMAGCRPDFFPVVLAAVEAMLDPAFNVYGINATTHPVAPLLVVNGPVAREIGMNAGYNCFGPGNRANATIGRAVRLVMVNIGGGTPGDGDRATHGHPGKYSYCIAENEARNPWAPLHVQRGFAAERSTVTVFGADAPALVNDHTSEGAAGVLSIVAGVLSNLGNNNSYFNGGEVCVVLGPEHAARIHAAGWSLADVKDYLYRRTGNRCGALRAAGKLGKLVNRRADLADDGEIVPIVGSPDHIAVLVAGGEGQHSMAISTFGMTRAVTRPVATWQRGREG